MNTRILYAAIASGLVGAVLAADPANLPPGPPPSGGAAFGVTAPIAPPVSDRAGFVSWRTLAMVKPVAKNGISVPQFAPSVEKLDKKIVKLQGFMLPLGMGETQDHFILTATPPTCAFCLPGGPDQVVEVKTKSPIKFSYDPIALSGRLELQRNDPMGLYYRMTGADSAD